MSRRRKGLDIHGVVLLDKPPGPSSNQALQTVRRLLQARKGGHTGTLDPFATGMLPLCFGEASKTTAQLLDSDKVYEAEALLGKATNTGDSEGEALMELPVPALTEVAIDAAMDRFRGDIEQVPPMFSALKHEGRPLYEWARQGITIPRKARPVSIYRLELLAWDAPRLRFRVECSKGTYIRTLCEDLAAALDTVGHLTALRRLRVGPFAPECMVTLERLQAAASEGTLHSQLLPVDAGLAGWPQIQLDESGAQAFCNGNPAPCAPSLSPEEGTKVLVRDAHDEPLGIGEISAGAVQPRKVFVFEPGAIRGTRELPENLENPAT